jgi:thiol:disulfide interchange protein DsbC
MYKIFSIFICLLVSTSIFAQSNAVSDQERKAITASVEKLSKQAGRKFTITNIQPTPIPGLFLVTSDLNVFYISKDGDYLVFGDLIDINQDKNNWSLTEKTSKKLRSEALAKLKESDMIIFPATAAKIGNAYVFTDIDCPYCHKLQDNIQKYTDKGIEIRYLAFPRSGPKTASFEKAISVWCAKDKPAAYTASIEEPDSVKKNQCNKNPVQMEFELGERMGVSGTPTIFLDDGTKIGGLVDAKTLVKYIQGEKK